MREAQVEKYLREQIEAAGGLCYKFVSPGRRHVPDRLCELGGWFMVEVKAPGEKLRAGQVRERERLKGRGMPVYVVDSKDEVDELLRMRLHPRKLEITFT
jgi:hypothetical protein